MQAARDGRDATDEFVGGEVDIRKLITQQTFGLRLQHVEPLEMRTLLDSIQHSRDAGLNSSHRYGPEERIDKRGGDQGGAPAFIIVKRIVISGAQTELRRELRVERHRSVVAYVATGASRES